MVVYPEDENQKDFQNRKNNNSIAIFIGAIFIVIGAILVLYNFDVIPWSVKRFFISWEMLLIAIGIYQFTIRNNVAGTILVLIGGFFILPELNYMLPDWLRINIDLSKLYWPVLIIGVGVLIISIATKNKKTPARRATLSDTNNSESSSNNSTFENERDSSNGGYIDVKYVFGGRDQIFNEPVFKGGNIETVFGGMTLDLRNSELAPGITRLKVSAVFGGVTLIVPPHWEVVVAQSSFLGGFSNNRRFTPAGSSNSKLIIEANCAFGGGEVK